MKLDIGSNLGWTIIGILGIGFYALIIVVGLPAENAVDIEKEKTKQLETQWKIDSIASANAVPYDTP